MQKSHRKFKKRLKQRQQQRHKTRYFQDWQTKKIAQLETEVAQIKRDYLTAKLYFNFERFNTEALHTLRERLSRLQGRGISTEMSILILVSVINLAMILLSIWGK